MYRPQFAWKTPDGYQDQDFSASFDGNTNTPLLQGMIASGVFLQNIILPLQPDQFFLWRGWKVQSYSIIFLNLFFQFKDPAGNYLSPAPVPAGHQVVPPGRAGFGFQTIPIEPEIPCPAGSNIVCYIVNPTPVPVQLPRVVLYGVKRGPKAQS